MRIASQIYRRREAVKDALRLVRRLSVKNTKNDKTTAGSTSNTQKNERKKKVI